MANISDVARRAGVSTTAVSFVLNGRLDQLGQETVERIRSAIQDLNYKPSAIAKALANRRMETIGVVVTHLVHPVETFIVSALVAHARAQGFNAFISDQLVHAVPPDPERDEAIIEEQIGAMIDHQVAGIVASVPLSDKVLERIRRSNIPVVAIDRFTGACDCVNVDFEAGSRMAVRHLYETGKRRLLFLDYGNPLNRSGMERAVRESEGMQLVREAMALKPAEAFAAVTEAIRDGVEFDCVYITSDWGAAGVYRALENEGRRIPDDVAIVGFDDTFGGFYSPSLTTVAQPLGKIGRTAFELLAARMAGEAPSEPSDVRLQPRLVKRESTGGPAPSKEDLVKALWESDLT